MARQREPDPPTQVATLERALADGQLARAYLFRGEERWFRERAQRAVAKTAQARGMEIARHDADDPDFRLSSLLDDLSAVPMFASARCVTVAGATKLLKKEGKRDAALTRAVVAFLESPGEGVVVLDAEGLRADHALAKAVRAAGGTLLGARKLFDGPPPWAPHDPRRSELVQWLVGRARQRKIDLTPDDAVLVCAATGNDLYSLDAKLEKLRSRGNVPGAGGAAGLTALVGDERAASPWSVAEELLARGELRAGLAGVERLFRTGLDKSGTRDVDPRALVAVLTAALRSKLRQALVGARVLARGDGTGAAADAAGVGTWPKARAEFEARLGARPAGDWPRMLRELAALERRTRENVTVDANDFFALALGWRR